MGKKDYLVFDFGASNGRAVLASFDGSGFDLEVTHRFGNRPVWAGGTLYWDILRLFSELKQGIQASLARTGDLRSMGIDAWGADFGLLDDRGVLMANPVNYRDGQSIKDAGSLFSIISGRELFELTGADINPIFDLFKIFSQKKNNPSSSSHASTYLPIGDLLNYFLTGRAFNEITRFTTSIIYNQKEKKLETSILERLGIPEHIFPRLILPGSRVGDISGVVSGELGISPFPVIAPAMHDTASAVAGIPLSSQNMKNWAFISLGTWACMGMEGRDVLIDDSVYEARFINEAGVEGTNLFVKNINGLWVIQQCRERWLKEEDISWDGIVEKAVKARPFASLIDVDRQCFMDAQADMPRVIQDFCRKTGQHVPETTGEISRCVYESLALKFRYYLGRLQDLEGREAGLLHIVGGGTQNRLLCQWIADATGKQVEAGPTETTAVGNLLMQLKADGEIKDIKEGREMCRGSSKVLHYSPGDTDIWDEAYNTYLGITGKEQ